MKTTLGFLTEEGRTRLKNGVRRSCAFVLVMLIVAGLSAYAIHRYWVTASFTTLQRVYLSQYWRSTHKSYLPNSISRYATLQRVVTDPKTKRDVSLAVHDADVMPLLDDNEQIQIKNGYPVLLLKKGLEHKQFQWRQSAVYDRVAYEWFRKHIYEDKSIPKIWRPAWLGAVLIFVLGTFGLISLDLFAQGRYMKGESIRGTRKLSPRGYARLHRNHTGYGITVYA